MDSLGRGPRNNLLDFGDDPDHELDANNSYEQILIKFSGGMGGVIQSRVPYPEFLSAFLVRCFR